VEVRILLPDKVEQKLKELEQKYGMKREDLILRAVVKLVLEET
jgi:hypothetical protein